MSTVVINLKSTNTAYEAVRDGVKLEFTHNSLDNSISGGFRKMDAENQVDEHLGGMHINADGLPSVNLSKQGTDFLKDWKTSIELVNDAINHIKNLKK